MRGKRLRVSWTQLTDIPSLVRMENLARILGVEHQIVSHWIRNVGLPHLRQPNGDVFIDKLDFIEWCRATKRLGRRRG